MIASVQLWWSALSLRERWLVGIAAVLAAIIVGWLLILQPLLGAIDSARDAHRAATDRHAVIMAQVDALRRPTVARTTVSSAPIDLMIAQSAAEQGFTLDRNQVSGGEASIAMASARAPALLAWLSALEARGMRMRDVTIRPNGNGTVALTATIAR